MDVSHDVKPPINEQQIFFVQNTEPKISSLNVYDDLPTKTGEVFRHKNGQYSFICFHCGVTFEDFGEIIGHCECHYQDQKYEIDTQPTEFVLCEKSDVPESTHTPIENIDVSKFTHTMISSLPLPERDFASIVSIPLRNELSSLNVKTKTSIRRKRKRRNPSTNTLNIPQNCPMCDVWCDDFRGHMKNEHKILKKVFQCYMCGRLYNHLQVLKKHLSAWNHVTNHCYHCEMEPPIKHPSEPRRHKCQFCKEWFPNHVEFKIHFKDAHDKDADFFFHRRANCNIFTCYICEREFPLRYYLVAHMRIHDDNTLRHQCPTCGKRVRTYGILTQHMKIHEGKIFQCDQCDKQFAFYARLRNHRHCHTTELKFKCTVCSKAFKLRHYLKKHMSVHINHRKYRCKYCDAAFNFTSGRRAHEKAQHGAI